MLNISNQFKNELYDDNRNYMCYADITLVDGTVLNLKDKDIWTDSFSIEDAVSGTSSFDIGAAIINKLTLSINNIYEEYSEYDFTGAVVVPYIGLELSDGRIEKIRKGVFTVDEASYDGSIITLSCLDNMYKLDFAYSESSLSYPATLGEIVRDICFVCGVTLLTTTFFNSSYVVRNRPDDQALTCRQVLSWAAQIACSWVRCDTYGRFRLDWYDLSVFENPGGLNGGVFDEGDPYKSGDTAFGGTFKPWTTGDDFHGGSFKELNSYHHVYSMSAMQICTDDVVITGLKVTESFEETDTDKVQSFLFGVEGYVIAVEGNDLIQNGMAETVAKSVGGRIVGMRFRPFDVSALNDPSMEAGDPVIVTDRKERSYQSYITSTTFKVGNYQQVQCSAETPSRNNVQRFSEATRNIVKAKWEAAKKISDYDKVMQMLTNLITQSFGVFKTEEKLEDGSTIFYLHDKPNVSESMTIWKMTADAFAVTTDGGKTWNAGMDSQGNVVVNVLSSIGINAEWINTGELVVKDDKGNVTLLANVDTGRVVINAESVSISGKSVADIAQGKVDAQTQTDIFNKLTNNGEIQGIYIQNGKLYINSEFIVTGKISSQNGRVYFDLDNSEIACNKMIDRSNEYITIDGISYENLVLQLQKVSYENRYMYGFLLCKEGNEDNGILISPSVPGGDISTIRGMNGLYIRGGAGRYGYPLIRLEEGGATMETKENSSVSLYDDNVILQNGGGGYIQISSGSVLISGNVDVMNGDFVVYGKKNRACKTHGYGDRLLYCYEMSSPMFGDIGTGKIDSTGQCHIYFDHIFQETITSEMTYYVVLQKEGQGDLWVEEKMPEYFIAIGTPGLTFSWEVKVRQRDYEYERMENLDDNEKEIEIDYGMQAETYLNDYEKEILGI